MGENKRYLAGISGTLPSKLSVCYLGLGLYFHCLATRSVWIVISVPFDYQRGFFCIYMCVCMCRNSLYYSYKHSYTNNIIKVLYIICTGI